MLGAGVSAVLVETISEVLEMRYVLEGEWSGYRSGQNRIVHREVVSTKKRAERLKNLQAIVFTDGTTLCLSLRKAIPRERIEFKHAYKSLIHDAEMTGEAWVYVSDLVRRRKALV